MLFKQTGVFYNFSTNWEPVGIQEAIPTESFIIRYTQKTPREVGKIIHQYIHQLFTQNGIPVPRRKRHHYYTIKRKQLREFFIIEALLDKKTLTTKQIETIIQRKLRYKTHHATIHKDLESLARKQIITKIKKPNYQNLYTIQINPITAILFDTILTQSYTPGAKLLLYTAFFNLAVPIILTQTQPIQTIYQILDQFKQKYNQYLFTQIQTLSKRIKIRPQYHQPSLHYQRYHKQTIQTQQYSNLQMHQQERLNWKAYHFLNRIIDSTKTTVVAAQTNTLLARSANKNSPPPAY
ncbi:MAG: hypothetical protein KatS3mg087_1545 [Patescibacteria group bacterium]|nr:MAG: hypothetical protein KatS3mg087_1545 [Patescibacteria group bacterium]